MEPHEASTEEEKEEEEEEEEDAPQSFQVIET